MDAVIGMQIHLCHHAGKDVAIGVGQGNAYVVGMCQRICHHTLLYCTALQGLVSDGLNADARCSAGLDGGNLLLGDADLHLQGLDVQDGKYGLAGQGGFSCANPLLAHHTVYGSVYAAILQHLPGGRERGLGLLHLALHLHPLHVGQGLVLVQLAHALQGIGGLLVRRLCHGQGVLCLGLVHLGNELTLAHALALANAYLLHHAHAGETHRHGG